MKKVLIFVILLSVLISCKQETDEKKDKETLITGEIENIRDENILIYYNNASRTLTANSEGFFKTEIDIAEPTYVYFSNGMNNAVFFANPGEEISFTGNYHQFIKTLIFDGSNENINEYLRKQLEIIHSAGLNTEQFMFAADANIFIASYNLLKKELMDNLQNFKSGDLFENEDFSNIEKIRLKYMPLPLLLQYYSRTKSQSEETNKSLTNLINSTLAELDINNSELLSIREYIDFLSEYVHYLFMNKIIEEQLEIFTIEDYAEILFGIIDNEFSDEKILEEMYLNKVDEIVNNYGVSGMNPYFDKLKEMTDNKERLKPIQDIFDVWENVAPGKPSADFAFPDIDGNIYTLDDFKGKYLYIDVWATWCGPCIREIPHLKELKKKYANRNIEIIAISVDENKTDWENYVNNQNLEGVQLYAGGWNNNFVQHFMITGIPRFILLDKEGMIIDANAPRPSTNIESVLENLDGL